LLREKSQVPLKDRPSFSPRQEEESAKLSLLFFSLEDFGDEVGLDPLAVGVPGSAKLALVFGVLVFATENQLQCHDDGQVVHQQVHLASSAGGRENP